MAGNLTAIHENDKILSKQMKGQDFYCGRGHDKSLFYHRKTKKLP